MLNELLRLSKETEGVEALIYYAEGEPLYVWSKREIKPELIRGVSRGIGELVSVIENLGEAIWEGQQGVYILKPAKKGYILAILKNWRSAGVYRKVFQKYFSKS